MKLTIQKKFLLACIFLVFLTAIGLSLVYYLITRESKHRETRKRIQIAFDIIFDDSDTRTRLYRERVHDFLQNNPIVSSTAALYAQDRAQIASKTFIVANLGMLVESLQEFGDVISADQLAFYGIDKRLLAIYQSHAQGEIMGVYALTDGTTPTFLLTNDTVTNRALGSLLLDDGPVPECPLPDAIAPAYAGEIPDAVAIVPFSREERTGLSIIAPIYDQEQKIGVLVGEVFYTEAMIARYAALSQNAVNFFAGNRLSVGTLTDQTNLDANILSHFANCDAIHKTTVGDREVDNIAIIPITLGEHAYYQAGCLLKNDAKHVGAITVSLSQDIEKQEIRKILLAVVLVSLSALGAACVLSLIFSRKTVHSINQLVGVIGSAAGGDLRTTASALTHDEIGMLATKLNQMITQLRTISSQVQHASQAVHVTADTILEQMGRLIQRMGGQSASVDTTTEAVEHVEQFIDGVAHNTGDLLSAAEEILSSLQETQMSIREVTVSIGDLTANLQQIFASIDQQNNSVKQISEHTTQLMGEAQQTETAVLRIDESLRGVSRNANQSQTLARETMDAALRGQASVEASILGMTDLKEEVAQIARIIGDVNAWGVRVSSILDLVDDITEQTSLLALNASIISAQAGAHGRGFAVVADEIKNLAMRTKDSTKEIGTLIHELQTRTDDGVQKTAEGIQKAEQGVHLANAVQDALHTILESATRSSDEAADTARVIQQTVADSQIISASINRVTEMVAHISAAIRKQEQDIEQVVAATESISGMAEQVNRASIEQRKTTDQVAESMEHVATQFSTISDQTSGLKQNVAQIVDAMHLIEATTTETLDNATRISTESVTNLLHESEVLQRIVQIFKVA